MGRTMASTRSVFSMELRFLALKSLLELGVLHRLYFTYVITQNMFSVFFTCARGCKLYSHISFLEMSICQHLFLSFLFSYISVLLLLSYVFDTLFSGPCSFNSVL